MKIHVALVKSSLVFVLVEGCRLAALIFMVRSKSGCGSAALIIYLSFNLSSSEVSVKDILSITIASVFER